MIEDAHNRCKRLLLEARVEGLSESDRTWLDRHMDTCEPCSGGAQLMNQALDGAIHTLRSVSVHVDPALIRTTRLRVWLRANELDDKRERMWGLWITCGCSWVLGVASAPFVWRAFEWIGHEADLPSLFWQTGFVLWWLIPAGAVAAVFALQRSRFADRGNGHNPEI